MLYTILPLEEIFPEDEAATKIITVDGIGVEVEEVKPGWGELEGSFAQTLKHTWIPACSLELKYAFNFLLHSLFCRQDFSQDKRNYGEKRMPVRSELMWKKSD